MHTNLLLLLLLGCWYTTDARALLVDGKSKKERDAPEIMTMKCLTVSTWQSQKSFQNKSLATRCYPSSMNTLVRFPPIHEEQETGALPFTIHISDCYVVSARHLAH